MPAPKSVTPRSAQAKAREAYHKVPTRTPAEDPGAKGWSKTPHEYGDLLITPNGKGQTKLGGALQRDLVYWIERNTWGNAKRPEYAKLSLTALAKLCGSDRRTVARAIADLQQRGIIEVRDREGCGPTVAKMYKLTPANWKKAKYYEAKAMEVATVDELEEAEEETAIAEAADEPEATVQPGRVSKPQSVAVSPSKGAPAVALRIVYRSVDLPFPVSFRAAPGRNGRVQISCRATAPQFFASSSPSVLPATNTNESIKVYSEALEQIVSEYWGKAPDTKLIESVTNAAAGAPVWLFHQIVAAKFKRGAGRHSTGLLIELAKDAASGHKLELQQAAKTLEANRPYLTPAQIEAIETEQRDSDTVLAAARCGKCKGTGKGRDQWANRNGEYKAWPTKCAACKGTGSKVAE